MKISQLDVEIIGPTKIIKNIFKQQQNISSPRQRLAQGGWANKAASLRARIMHTFTTE